MKELFFTYFNSCYMAINNKSPNFVFLIYDKQIDRQRKLCRILNATEINLNPNPINGEIYFKIDLSNKLFLISYRLWYIFENNYGSYSDIENEIVKWLNGEKFYINYFYDSDKIINYLENEEIWKIIEQVPKYKYFKLI